MVVQGLGVVGVQPQRHPSPGRGARLDTALRPLELTVPQYACLELLRRRPGLSNAELARGAFVTRQSMNGVLRGLLDRGLLTRPTTAPHGRARPTQLTPIGRERLLAASAAVLAIEEQMLSYRYRRPAGASCSTIWPPAAQL